MEPERQDGYYWIKSATIEGIQEGKWQPVYYSNEDGWGDCDSYHATDIQHLIDSGHVQVGERVHNPYEK